MNRLRKIDFSHLDWKTFEQLCHDILIVNGLKNVRLQGDNCPAFDIICEETSESLIKTFNIRWGVQCKHWDRRIGQDVFNNIIPESNKRRINSILLISTLGFTDRAIQYGEDIVFKNDNILNIDFWDDHALRSNLAKHPNLIPKYFDIDFDKKLFDQLSSNGLLDWIASTTGINIDNIEQLITQKDIFNIASNLNRISHFGGVQFPKRIIYDRIARNKPAELPNNDLKNKSIIYDSFEELEHFTTIKNFPKETDCKIQDKYFNIIDTIHAKVHIKNVDDFVFAFVRTQDAWNKSHIYQSNEYTWQFHENTIINDVIGYVNVSNFTIDDIELECTFEEINDDYIVYKFNHSNLKKMLDKTVVMKYTVSNIFPIKNNRIFSSLHAHTNIFRFSLTMASGFPVKPSVNFFFSNSIKLPDIIYQPDDNPVIVMLKMNDPIPKGSGLVITW